MEKPGRFLNYLTATYFRRNLILGKWSGHILRFVQKKMHYQETKFHKNCQNTDLHERLVSKLAQRILTFRNDSFHYTGQKYIKTKRTTV